jgi:sporulation protein YlmC with PRC-barrel domain
MNRRFQLDLLIGRQVYDAEGRKLGRVDEILLVRQGEVYEVEGLLTGANSLLERLGVARPIGHLQKRLNLLSRGHESNIIHWEQIDTIGEEAIRLKVPRGEIRTVEPNGRLRRGRKLRARPSSDSSDGNDSEM